MSKKEIWDQFSPWLYSAFFSSAATFALLILFVLFPGVKEYLTIGDDSLYYIPFIGLCAPSERTPLTFLVWASLIYCGFGLGFTLSKWNPLAPGGWRSVISKIFLSLELVPFSSSLSRYYQ